MTSTCKSDERGSVPEKARARDVVEHVLAAADRAISPVAGGRSAAVLVVLVLGLGFWLRTRGMFGGVWGRIFPFWLDEVDWAERVVSLPLSESLFRPLGFMAVSKLLATYGGVGEVQLRLLPWAASIATLYLTPLLGARLFRSPVARVGFVALIALHPAAVDLAKEFKPYSVSLAAHAAGLLLTLRALERPTAGRIVALTAGLLSGVLFAQDIVFLWPASFLLVGLALLRARAHRLLAGMVAGAALCALVALGFYFTMWRTSASESGYWGRRYDVFYVDRDSSKAESKARLAWTAGKYAEMAAYPGLRAELPKRSEHPDGLAPTVYSSRWLGINNSVWLSLHLLGIGSLVLSRRWLTLALFGIPLITLGALNYMTLWPFGAFRANLFLVLAMTSIPLFVVEVIAVARSGRIVAGLLLTALIVPPLLVENRWHAEKVAGAWKSQAPEAVRRLISLRRGERGAPAPLLLDYWSCNYYKFYTERHSKFSARFGERARASFEPSCGLTVRSVRVQTAAAMSSSSRIWVLLSMPQRTTRVESTLLRQTNLVRREVIGNSHVLLEIAPRSSVPR